MLSQYSRLRDHRNLAANLSCEECLERTAMRGSGPVIFEVFGYMMGRNQGPIRETSHYRMQILPLVSGFGISLSDPAYIDVERIDLIMMWTIFETDGEVATTFPYFALVDVVDRQLFEVPGTSLWSHFNNV